MPGDEPGAGNGAEAGKQDTPGANEDKKDQKTESGKESGGTQSDNSGETQPAPDAGSKDDAAKPVSVSLDTDANLTKKEDKYELVLNVTNANEKYLEVELTEILADGQDGSKVTSKAKVHADKVTVTFESLKEGTKYKVSSLKLYDTDKSTTSTSVEVSKDLSSKELKTNDVVKPIEKSEVEANKAETNKITIQSVRYEYNEPTKYTYIIFRAKTSKEFFDKIKDKHFDLQLRKSDGKVQSDETDGSGIKPYKLSEEGDNVLFEFYPAYPWGKGANFIVTKVSVKDDPQTNILASEYEVKSQETVA
ncbi:hypothetical protein JM47_01150 [Ureaplasma diversum]|uniref:Uncharacterized protein n=1 Tax=Ureaplasma diversum TaxID=42094 RepID=A0A0C5RBG3_9BACT|nr:hypothetical protein [Ureaplasma diversum]AJQ45231.1 hypothetical protein JM47_01150 [Ureaplasma diversum]